MRGLGPARRHRDAPRCARIWLSSVAPDNPAGPGAPPSISWPSATGASPSSAAAPACWSTRIAAPAGQRPCSQAGLPADPASRREHAEPRRRRAGPATRAGATRAPHGRLVLQRRGGDRRASTPWTARGLAAGRDFAVVGFDDIADARLIHRRSPPSRVDSRRLGEHAAAILLEQMAGARAGPRHVTGDARLIVRASCGAAGSPEPEAA